LSGHLGQYINLYMGVYLATEVKNFPLLTASIPAVAPHSRLPKSESISYGVKRQEGDGNYLHPSSAERIRGAIPSLFHA
jgi:hypothetical protein